MRIDRCNLMWQQSDFSNSSWELIVTGQTAWHKPSSLSGFLSLNRPGGKRISIGQASTQESQNKRMH